MEQVKNEQTIYSAAVCYRLSKDDEQAVESVSIETQKMMLTDYKPWKRSTYMSFRKDCLLFFQEEICYILLVVSCLLIIPMTGFVFFSLLLTLLFVTLALVTPFMHNEIITIDAIGISCSRSDKQLWSYRWEYIATLQRSSRYRLPSVEIAVYSMRGEQGQTVLSGHYFQLGIIAKKGI